MIQQGLVGWDVHDAPEPLKLTQVKALPAGRHAHMHTQDQTARSVSCCCGACSEGTCSSQRSHCINLVAERGECRDETMCNNASLGNA
jgi:hypothetical protein